MLRQLCIDVRVRLTALFARRRIYSRADEELKFHLAMREQRLIEAGVPPGEAHERARRAMGNPTLLTEQTVDSWRYTFVDTLIQDVRYGLRTLRKNPGFTATAVLSLALGIGANTAIFSLFDALLFRPLPVASPEELVLATQRFADRQFLMLGNRHREALAGSETLVGLCASRHSQIRATAAGDSQFVDGMLASGNCFSLLGVSAIRGRMITEADDQPSAGQPVAVLSYRYWQSRFGADENIIGQSITVEDRPFAIVGVAPRGFMGLEPGKSADIILPLNIQGGPLLANPNVFWLRLLGRRKHGVSLEQVQADLAVRFARVERNPKAKGPPARLEVVPAGSGFGDARTEFALPLRILMGAVALVLLIACMNLASLLLARASGRRQEINLRVALGAGSGRIVRQLLTESMLLSTIGGLVALGIAWVASPLLAQSMSRGRTPIVLDLAPEWRTLAFTAAVSLLTGLLFGIVPALRAVRQWNTHHGSRIKTGSRRWSGALIISQVALCVIVLASAGLLLESLRKLQQVDAGFRKDHLLVLSMRLDKYQGPAAIRLHQELYQRFTALPGVESVTTFSDLPLGGVNVTTNDFSINTVGERFFETMGIPLLTGRTLNEQDALNRRPVAVISESVAHHFFPDRDPLGQYLDVMGTDREVIGVVKDARYRSLRLPAEPMVYAPAVSSGSYAIRTTVDPATLASAVRRELREAASDIPIWSLNTLDADATLARERIVSNLCSWFGGFALLIASVGLYGRLSYAVTERTGEIGVRMALGAGQGQVTWMVLRDALILTICGITIGVPLALASTQVFRSLLFEVRASDAATFAVILAGIVGVTSIAGYIPARRAASVDPVIALRTE